MVSPVTVLQTADWRRRVFGLYAQVRLTSQEVSPSYAHELWRAERDKLFAEHPASPLKAHARERFRGLRIGAYDPDLRCDALIDDDGAGQEMNVATGTDGVVPFVRLGTVDADGVGRLAVWRLATYGGGILLPVRDGMSGADGGSYGGGRYLLDTIKGADLGPGAAPGSLVLDFNFWYNPSCAYDEAWACPLPGPDNRTDVQLRVGEMYAEY